MGREEQKKARREYAVYILEEILVFLVLIFAILTAEAIRKLKRGEPLHWQDVFGITPETALRVFAAMGTWGGLHQIWKHHATKAPLYKRIVLAAGVGRGFRGDD
jgi:hypothetical protein